MPFSPRLAGFSTLGILAGYLGAQCPDLATLTPTAILDDGLDSTLLEVTPGGAASSVTLRAPAGTPLVAQGVSACAAPLSVPLYDDGTHGDRTARDGVFSIADLRWDRSAPASCATGLSTRPTPSLRLLNPGELVIVRGGITSTIPAGQFALWVLPVAEFGVPEPVVRLSGEVQVSAHVVNVADDQQRVNRILSGDFGASVQDLSRKVYAALPDVYDFLNFTSSSQRLCSGGKSTGVHFLVKQTWTGTGTPPFDTAASYGSGGKLLGINLIEQQSSDSFAVFAHETVHQWAAYLPGALGLAGVGGHWSDKTDLAGAVGGGNWTANGDGTYWAAPPALLPRWRLAPLELYLMGLASPAEVPPIQVTESAPLSFGQAGSRVVGPFKQVTVAQIQQAVGARTPGPESAQRAFRTAFVVTSPGRLLTAREMTAYDRISRLFTGALQPRPGNPPPTFAEITGGRATLETSTLPCSFSLSVADVSVGAAGASGTVFLSAPASYCQWSAAGTPGWITITGGTSGLGSGSFSYFIAPNQSAAARSGFLTVSGTVALQRVPVLQAGQAESAASSLSRPVSLGGDCPAADAACLGSLVTRGQMAVFVVRALMRGDAFSYAPAPYFDDVPANHAYFPWVQKLKELGITSGCAARRFCVGSAVTRGEMAAFLIRARLGITASQGFPFPSKPYFKDVPMSHQFFAYVQKMRETGVTLGCSASEYCPDAPATRGQMGVFLTRAFAAE